MTRGGWPRAELHHGSILQNASVYTISRAVRTSGEATEDQLNLEFVSSFRCKCSRLNVILPHNSSDCLTNTWWSMKTIKREVFCDRVPEWWVHARSISPTHADGYFRSCHFSNVYRYVNNCASREIQIYATQPRIMISSKRKLIKMRFLLTKYNCLHFCLWLENCTFPSSSFTELKRYSLFHRSLSDFVYCLNICHICYLAWYYSAVFYCTTEKCVCVSFHYWSLSWNYRVIWNTAVLC